MLFFRIDDRSTTCCLRMLFFMQNEAAAAIGGDSCSGGVIAVIRRVCDTGVQCALFAAAICKFSHDLCNLMVRSRLRFAADSY